MADANYAIFAYSRKGFDFHVYSDRVEVSERKMLKPEKHTYLISDIARVDIKDTPTRLSIVMKDGTESAYRLSTNATAARNAITELL